MEGVQGVAGGWAWIDTQGVFGARPPWASWPPMHHHASTPAPSMPLQRHQHQTNNNTSAALATIWSRATIITYLVHRHLSFAAFQVNPTLSEKQDYARYVVLYIVQLHLLINLRQDAKKSFICYSCLYFAHSWCNSGTAYLGFIFITLYEGTVPLEIRNVFFVSVNFFWFEMAWGKFCRFFWGQIVPNYQYLR